MCEIYRANLPSVIFPLLLLIFPSLHHSLVTYLCRCCRAFIYLYERIILHIFFFERASCVLQVKSKTLGRVGYCQVVISRAIFNAFCCCETSSGYQGYQGLSYQYVIAVGNLTQGFIRVIHQGYQGYYLSIIIRVYTHTTRRRSNCSKHIDVFLNIKQNVIYMKHIIHKYKHTSTHI